MQKGVQLHQGFALLTPWPGALLLAHAGCSASRPPLIPTIKSVTYSERLKACKLPTLHYRHIRGDMIEMFKILSGKYDIAVTPWVNQEYNSITRGNDLRLQKHRTFCISTFLQTGHLLFGIVYLTMSSCLIQLIHLNPNLINSGNNNLLYMILKPKFLEPEVEVSVGN